MLKPTKTRTHKSLNGGTFQMITTLGNSPDNQVTRKFERNGKTILSIEFKEKDKVNYVNSYSELPWPLANGKRAECISDNKFDILEITTGGDSLMLRQLNPRENSQQIIVKGNKLKTLALRSVMTPRLIVEPVTERVELYEAFVTDVFMTSAPKSLHAENSQGRLHEDNGMRIYVPQETLSDKKAKVLQRHINEDSVVKIVPVPDLRKKPTF